MMVVYGTPKAISKLTPEVLQKVQTQFGPFTVISTTMVYMNCLGGWTEDECDAVLYIVEEPA